MQRVGMAQALLNDPEIVFLDEPMSGLDPLGRREVRDIMLRLRDRGSTVFFSSHILADAEAICSSVGIVSGGRLVAAGRSPIWSRPRRAAGQLVVGGLDSALAERLVGGRRGHQPRRRERHLVHAARRRPARRHPGASADVGRRADLAHRPSRTARGRLRGAGP